jgi:hypothetical protein
LDPSKTGVARWTPARMTDAKRFSSFSDISSNTSSNFLEV